MRRVVILGLLVAAVAGWMATRAEPEQLVVEFSVDSIGLSFEDPCTPMPEITGGYATGGGSYGGLWEVDSRADGEAVASCYEANGIAAEIHAATDAEKERLQQERRDQEFD